MKLNKWMTAAALSAWTGFAVLAAAQTSAPVTDDLFAGTEIFAKGASDVSEVTMDPDTLGLVEGPNSHAAHSMVLNVVRSYQYDKPGMYNIADVDAFRNKLNTGDWHCSVHTRDLKTNESTDICNKRRTDGYIETAIITVEPKELTFIHTIRKQHHDGDHSEVDGLMVLPGMAGLPLDAMLDVHAIPDIHISPDVHIPEIHISPDIQVPDVHVPDIHVDLSPLEHMNFDDMQRQIEKSMKDFKGPDAIDLQLKLQDAQKSLEKAQKDFEKDSRKAGKHSDSTDKQPE